MRKIRKVTHEIEEVFVEDVLCNMCGESCPGYRDDRTGLEPECITIDHTWGYWSSQDMTRHSAHICEGCWATITESFKIRVGEVDLLDPTDACPGADEAFSDVDEFDAYAVCPKCWCCAGAHNTYISGGGCSCGNCHLSCEDVEDAEHKL